MEKETKNALVYLLLIASILFTVSQKSAIETDESLDSKVSEFWFSFFRFSAQVVEHTHHLDPIGESTATSGIARHHHRACLYVWRCKEPKLTFS